MTSRHTHTAQNTDAIRVAAVVGCAVMALAAALILVQFFAVLLIGHGVVPAEIFSACALLALVVPVAAALTIDEVRSLLRPRVRQGFADAHLAVYFLFLSALMALALPPPRAALGRSPRAAP